MQLDHIRERDATRRWSVTATLLIVGTLAFVILVATMAARAACLRAGPATRRGGAAPAAGGVRRHRRRHHAAGSQRQVDLRQRGRRPHRSASRRRRRCWPRPAREIMERFDFGTRTASRSRPTSCRRGRCWQDARRRRSSSATARARPAPGGGRSCRRGRSRTPRATSSRSSTSSATSRPIARPKNGASSCCARSSELNSSLDYEATLAAVARLAVPDAGRLVRGRHRRRGPAETPRHGPRRSGQGIVRRGADPALSARSDVQGGRARDHPDRAGAADGRDPA